MKKIVSWQDLMEIMKSHAGAEIRFRAGEDLQKKSSGQWKEIPGLQVGADNLLEILQQRLGKIQLQIFEQQGSCKFFDFASGVHLQLNKTRTGTRVWIRTQPDRIALNDFGLPAGYLDLLQRSGGLHLISGSSLSGKSTLMETLALHQAEGGKSVAILADEIQGSDLDQVDQLEIAQLRQGPFSVRGYDVIFIDSKQEESWRWAMSWAEAGVPIIMSIPFLDLKTATLSLPEILSRSLPGFAGISERRFFSSLQSALGLRLLPGVEGQKHVGFELLILNFELREYLRLGQWSKVESEMFLMSEKSGMRTLNQCLLNLMIKRKIDFKVGFSTSPDPEDLDRMLHQVGI